MILSSQDPPKKQEPQDTVVVKSERQADSLYIQQKATKEKLEELMEKKKIKK